MDEYLKQVKQNIDDNYSDIIGLVLAKVLIEKALLDYQAKVRGEIIEMRDGVIHGTEGKIALNILLSDPLLTPPNK